MKSQTVIAVVVVMALGYLIWAWPKIKDSAMQVKQYHYYSQFVTDLHDGTMSPPIPPSPISSAPSPPRV